MMAETKTKKTPAKTGTKKETKPKVSSDTFAIIETGGKQYSVAVDDVVRIEKLDVEEGKKVTFDKVLLVDDGKNTQIGDPYLKGAKVEGEVVETGKEKKMRVLRFRAKSRHLKQRGHRQPYTEVRITALK